ncbi:MAG: folate family ECF transporter S component [Tenericutes bacterium]|nr:folate family ECF transporter S component [Mycoplasmatota bacterium]
MKQLRLRKTILAALLVAIGIVLSQFLSVTYPPNNAIIRFGIGYIPLIIISIILGPRIGAASAVIQDVLGYFVYMLVFGSSGPFFPGFTINAVLFGVIPGLVYNLILKEKKIFNVINFVLLLSLIGLGIYALIDMPAIISTIGTDVDFQVWFLYMLLIIGEAGLISIFIFVFTKRKEDDKSHRIIFSVIIMQIITALILTPLWVSVLYGIPFWAQLPLRIIKTPIEIFIYSILLIRIITALNTYMLREE